MWWFCGFVIAFGTDEDRNVFAGGGDGKGLFLEKARTQNDYQMWFFQVFLSNSLSHLLSLSLLLFQQNLESNFLKRTY